MQRQLHFLSQQEHFQHDFKLKSLFLIIYSSICFIFKHLPSFFRFSIEKCLTPYLIRPNIRPPLKRPYRLEA